MIYSLIVKTRRAIKTLVRKFGYDIVVFPRFEGPYERFHIKVLYAPWIEDRDFVETFPKVQTHSMVDRYRCYELWDLVSQSAKLRGSLLEIGVWRGGTGALIAKQAQLSGIPDPVYLCDTFEGVVKASEKDDGYRGGEHGDTSEEIVVHLMKELGLSNTRILKGIFPEATGEKIANEQFRFCHIDVDVYNSAKDIVDWIWPRLVVGGILVFDDYGFPTTTGIRDFVNDVKYERDRICLFNLNGHSVWVKIA
jgi:O-methyltransferase